MTIVKVWLVDIDSSIKTKRIKVEGHSNYADNGYDIICSSISTAMIMTGNLIEKICPKYNINYDEEKVSIDIKIIEGNDFSYIVLDNLKVVLTDLSNQYPEFVKISIQK